MRDCHRWWSGLLAVLGLWAGASCAVAASFVEHLSPPSLPRGKTCRVTLVGSELRGATGLWTSLPAKVLTATLVEPSQESQASLRREGRSRRPAGPLRAAPGHPKRPQQCQTLLDRRPAGGYGTGFEPPGRGAAAPALARGGCGESRRGRHRPVLHRCGRRPARDVRGRGQPPGAGLRSGRDHQGCARPPGRRA